VRGVNSGSLRSRVKLIYESGITSFLSLLQDIAERMSAVEIKKYLIFEIADIYE
jgi:hypothetical protein